MTTADLILENQDLVGLLVFIGSFTCAMVTGSFFIKAMQ